MRHSISQPITSAFMNSAPEVGLYLAQAVSAEATGPAGWMIVFRCVSSKSSTCELMPLIKAACSTSKRSDRPKSPAWGGPENGLNAATAWSGAPCREPPTATPTQFKSVRAASFLTLGGDFGGGRGGRVTRDDLGDGRLG